MTDYYRTADICHFCDLPDNVNIFTIQCIWVCVYIGIVIMVNEALVNEITQLHADICSALADPRRILILYALSEKPSNVSDIAAQIGISQPAASRHLNILRERGMVSAQRDGQSVIYQLTDQRSIQALDLLRSVLGDTLKNRGNLASAVLDTA